MNTPNTHTLIQGQTCTTKKLRDKDFAELSGELSGAICLEALVIQKMPSNCSENYLVLFARFFGFVGPSPLSICLGIIFQLHAHLLHKRNVSELIA